jgi:hypothetical protein
MKKLAILLCLCCNLAVAGSTHQADVSSQQTSSKLNPLTVYETGQLIRTILDTLHWKANFILMEKDGINNAYATVMNGRRVIVYDNRFLNKLNEITGTNWAAVSVIAHEIGHHYNNDVMTDQASTPENELQADYFSGYVMEKLGATANEATIAIRMVNPAYASGSHPGSPDRVNSIESGWNYAKNLNNDPIRPDAVPASRQTPAVLAKTETNNWIRMSLQATDPMTVYLSDDGRNYSPARVKTRQPFVFKFEMYGYGYMRFNNDRNSPTYRLIAGKDYSIIWDRSSRDWRIAEVSLRPEV